MGKYLGLSDVFKILLALITLLRWWSFESLIILIDHIFQDPSETYRIPIDFIDLIDPTNPVNHQDFLFLTLLNQLETTDVTALEPTTLSSIL